MLNRPPEIVGTVDLEVIDLRPRQEIVLKVRSCRLELAVRINREHHGAFPAMTGDNLRALGLCAVNQFAQAALRLEYLPLGQHFALSI